jgi:hypothetical protein
MNNKISHAREVLKKAFKADSNFRDTYQANIAMYLWDEKRRGKTFNRYQCNEIADGLIKLIFES